MSLRPKAPTPLEAKLREANQKLRADLTAANERIAKQAVEIAELESGYQNAAELAMTYHGELERANERIARLERALRDAHEALLPFAEMVTHGPGSDHSVIGDLRRAKVVAEAIAALSPAGTVTPPSSEKK